MAAVVIQVAGVVVNALVCLKAALNQIHCGGHKEAEGHDNGVNAEVCPDHDSIETGHDQNSQIFIEILNSDRVAGPHQNVATML